MKYIVTFLRDTQRIASVASCIAIAVMYDGCRSTQEKNVNLPALDGAFKHSRRALVEGIIYAKHEIKRRGLKIVVGFNATPDFNPDKTFWKEIRTLASPQFYEAIDYVGLDFFPGVFRPLPSTDPELVSNLIAAVVSAFKQDMADAGLPDNTPLHITENGFATTSERSEELQSEMMALIVNIIVKMKNKFNIRCYELFALRDANSSVDDVFHQLGIMKDDYTPKTAFMVYQKLIQMHTVAVS